MLAALPHPVRIVRPQTLGASNMTDLLAHAPLAFAAGLLSVFSPCVLPLLPAYLSLVSGVSVEELGLTGAREDAASDARLHRSLVGAVVGFIAGFTSVFVLLGVGAVTLGHLVRGWRLSVAGLELSIAQIAGVFIALLGLHMLGWMPIRWLRQWLDRDTRPVLGGGERSVLSTFLVGAGFALGWSPCIGPILSGVLTLAASRETVWQGTALLLVYSAGLAVPFALAGMSVEVFFRAFVGIRRHLRALEVVSGAVLVAAGLLLATNQFGWLNARFAFLNEWVLSLEQALL